jgi:hypothetical protein
MHEHEFSGQKLRHDHPGGDRPHGYFEHPEDGSRAADVESTTPLADALALVDKAMADGFAPDGSVRRHLTKALWGLSEAVRVSLLEFSELDVRALAVTAAELYRNDYRGAAEEYLSERQLAVLDKARELFGDGS